MKKIFIAIVLLLALFQSSSVLAQDLFKTQDLSTIKVDYLSDADITKIKAQLQSNSSSRTYGFVEGYACE